MFSVILHMMNEDPVVGEMEELPQKTDSIIYLLNPRRRDGKDVPYLEANITAVAWPVTRITFIEVLPGAEDEEIISFVREK